jgi:hypothetical protein
MVLSVADADDAFTHIIVEVHINGLTPITRLDVGMAHITVAQRAFDVDFVLIVDEGVVSGFFHARNGHECDDYGACEC